MNGPYFLSVFVGCNVNIASFKGESQEKHLIKKLGKSVKLETLPAKDGVCDYYPCGEKDPCE